jgi:hypothetical protein
MRIDRPTIRKGLIDQYLDFPMLGVSPTGPATGNTRVFFQEGGKLYVLPPTGPAADISAGPVFHLLLEQGNPDIFSVGG